MFSLVGVPAVPKVPSVCEKTRLKRKTPIA